MTDYYCILFIFVGVETHACRSGNADDFIAFTGRTVTFPADPAAGSTQQTVDIYIINGDGNTDYQDEIFCVRFMSPAPPDNPCPTSNRGELDIPRQIEITILNDDSKYS